MAAPPKPKSPPKPAYHHHEKPTASSSAKVIKQSSAPAPPVEIRTRPASAPRRGAEAEVSASVEAKLAALETKVAGLVDQVVVHLQAAAQERSAPLGAARRADGAVSSSGVDGRSTQRPRPPRRGRQSRR